MTTNTTTDNQPPAAVAALPAPDTGLARVKLDTWLAEKQAVVIIRPLHDRILAKRLEAEDKTSGGLFIPDNAREKPLEAVVISVGTGKLLENGRVQPLVVKVGDTILIAKYSGSDIKVLDKDHIIVREDDVLAVLEGSR